VTLVWLFLQKKRGNFASQNVKELELDLADQSEVIAAYTSNTKPKIIYVISHAVVPECVPQTVTTQHGVFSFPFHCVYEIAFE
jgi:flavoprotein